MHNRRRQLLASQTKKGLGPGGFCPECGSSDTVLLKEDLCETCGEVDSRTIFCHSCREKIEISLECNCYCPVCGTHMVTDSGGWQYCPNCGYNS